LSAVNDNRLRSDPGIPAHAPADAAPVGGDGATPMQRERATTIFEKGAPGRRAFVAPPLDVTEVDAVQLLPARLRRAEPARLPELS